MKPRKRLGGASSRSRRSMVVLGLAAALLCVGLFLGLGAVAGLVADHPYFLLRSVRVNCDSAAVEPGDLAVRAGLFEGTSLWRIDTEEISRALERASWVRMASVKRVFPSEVRLKVLRRRAIAATLFEDGPWLIDEGGVVFREEGRYHYPDLPWLSGWEAAPSRGARVNRLRQSVALLREARAKGVSVSQIDVTEGGETWVFPDDAVLAVNLGVGPDPHDSVGRLVAIFEDLAGGLGEVREIDLSSPGMAVVKASKGRLKRLMSLAARPAGPGASGGREGRG
ncbi:MAG: cell division protein FtsQ/DivIB [Candidatus Binatia bacterium]